MNLFVARVTFNSELGVSIMSSPSTDISGMVAKAHPCANATHRSFVSRGLGLSCIRMYINPSLGHPAERKTATLSNESRLPAYNNVT